LSNDTIKKRIDGLSGNIKEQLLRKINKSDYFSLQLDESTNITNKSVLLCYVRYEYKNIISEDVIVFVTTVVHTTAEEIFCKINEFKMKKDSKYFIQHMGDMQRSFRDCFPVPDISRNWIRRPFEIYIH